MPILAIDTSGAISLAVLDDEGGLLGEAFDPNQRWHAERLAPLVNELLDEIGLNPDELTSIAVGTGPGPFTGLRIGLATAEALGFAIGIPVYGVGSLKALATGAAATLGLATGTEIIAVLDARRKEVYWATYRVMDGGVAEVSPPQVTSPAQVPPASAGAIIVGDGAAKYGLTAQDGTALQSEGGEVAPVLFPEAKWVGLIALAQAANGVPQPTVPLYLRRADIQGQAPQPLAPGERG